MKLKIVLRQATILAGIAAIGATALSALFYVAGGRVNSTRSIPLGIYWTSSKPVEKGAYVMLCPPPRLSIEATLAPASALVKSVT